MTNASGTPTQARPTTRSRTVGAENHVGPNRAGRDSEHEDAPRAASHKAPPPPGNAVSARGVGVQHEAPEVPDSEHDSEYNRYHHHRLAERTRRGGD